MNLGKARHGIFAVILTICVVSPSAARAESDVETRQQAKEHYEMATRFYDVGKYGEAINEYEQAYLLIEDAALLFNIGQAYRLWDKPEDAMRAYKNYLRRRPEASNRTDVERKIADLEKVIDDRHRGVPVQPPAQPVTPNQPPPPSTPGDFPIYPGQPPGQGGPNTLAPSAAPLPEQQPAAVAFTQPAPNEPVSPRRKWIAYGLLGVGGVALMTTVIAAAVGANKAKTLREASQNRQPFDPAVESSGKSANAVAGLSALVAIGAGGTGGYLLWRWRGSDGPAVGVLPVVAPTFAGASASVTF